MFSQRPRRDFAARNRRAAVRPETEALEGRQLLSYSPIGSLPDLTVTAQAGAIAAYGGPISVTLDVRNLGASSLVEPLALQPGAVSTADAGPSHVGVYLLKNKHVHAGGGGSVLVGEIAIPAVPQNSLVTVSQTLILPARPHGFPGSGGNVLLAFRADDQREVRDIDRTNNIGSIVPLQIEAALPDLTAIALDVPPTMQPGDVIAPSIKIANYGTVDSATQGPVTVLLVASTDGNYGPTDVILGRYEITDLPGLSQAPQRRTVLGDVNARRPAQRPHPRIHDGRFAERHPADRAEQLLHRHHRRPPQHDPRAARDRQRAELGGRGPPRGRRHRASPRPASRARRRPTPTCSRRPPSRPRVISQHQRLPRRRGPGRSIGQLHGRQQRRLPTSGSTSTGGRGPGAPSGKGAPTNGGGTAKA